MSKQTEAVYRNLSRAQAAYTLAKLIAEAEGVETPTRNNMQKGKAFDRFLNDLVERVESGEITIVIVEMEAS